MRIAATASAFPKYRYSQKQLLDGLGQYWAEQLDEPRMLQRLHMNMGVDDRYLSLPMKAYEGLDSWGQANDVWIETSLELAERTLCCALARAGFAPDRLGALFFVSITGVASPSIDARLMNRMSLPANLKRIPVFGLGCVGGAAGIGRAADYVRGFPDQIAAVVCVELCSLTLQRDDTSIANLISSGLFGDGGAGVIVSGAEFPGSPEILDTRSSFYPDTERVMGWDISEKGFRIVLSRDVPAVIREHLASDVDSFLAEHDLTRQDIGAWIMHTGGPAVLEATAAALELPPEALRTSWECLRRTGNLSSASVLLVLDEFLYRKRPPPNTYGILAAMGPGFCSELVLLRW